MTQGDPEDSTSLNESQPENVGPQGNSLDPQTSAIVSSTFSKCNSTINVNNTVATYSGHDLQQNNTIDSLNAIKEKNSVYQTIYNSKLM